MNNGLAKYVIAMLGSALLTFLLVWFTAVNDKVSRTEARYLVDTSGPYLADRATLLNGVALSQLAIDRLTAEIAALSQQQAITSTRLDLVLKQLDRLEQRP